MQKHFSAQEKTNKQWLHVFIKVRFSRQMVKLWRAWILSCNLMHILANTLRYTNAHYNPTYAQMSQTLRAQSQNSMLQSKGKTARAQAGDAWGPSAAHWGYGWGWGGWRNPHSWFKPSVGNKRQWGGGSVPSPRAAILNPITILRLNKQPKTPVINMPLIVLW